MNERHITPEPFKAFILQGLRFGVVGGLATGVYGLATSGSHALGLAHYAANLAGFALSMAVSFLGHFYWTFGKRSEHGRHFLRFLVMSAFGFALSNAILYLVLTIARGSFAAAIAANVVTVPVLTWMAARYWTFK